MTLAGTRWAEQGRERVSPGLISDFHLAYRTSGGDLCEDVGGLSEGRGEGHGSGLCV